jgi:hypothetical protein
MTRFLKVWIHCVRNFPRRGHRMIEHTFFEGPDGPMVLRRYYCECGYMDLEYNRTRFS